MKVTKFLRECADAIHNRIAHDRHGELMTVLHNLYVQDHERNELLQDILRYMRYISVTVNHIDFNQERYERQCKNPLSAEDAHSMTKETDSAVQMETDRTGS